MISIEGGFPFIEASGVPGLAVATGTTPATSPDDQGNPRDPPGLATIGILSRGSGYLQPPNVVIFTLPQKAAVATIRPAANGRANEIDTITVTLLGGDDPFDLMLMELIPSNGSLVTTHQEQA